MNKDIAEAAVKALVEKNVRLWPKYWKPGKPLEYLGEDELYYSFSYDGMEICYIKAENRAEEVPRKREEAKE